MGTRRTLTIGATVNLEHYENLRLEVTGEIDSPGDADALTEFLDTMLGRMGRGDPATSERIDNYRKRVLRRPPELDSVAGTESQETPAPLPRPLPVRAEDRGVRSAAGRETALDRIDPGPEPEAIGVTSQGDSLQSPEPADAEGPVCDACGIPISMPEEKMSRLFTNRALCRACMKKA